MGNEFDAYMEEKYHGNGYVSIYDCENMSLDPRIIKAIIRNAERPSDWSQNRLLSYTCTLNGLEKSAGDFLKENPEF